MNTHDFQFHISVIIQNWVGINVNISIENFFAPIYNPHHQIVFPYTLTNEYYSDEVKLFISIIRNKGGMLDLEIRWFDSESSGYCYFFRKFYKENKTTLEKELKHLINRNVLHM